MFYNCIHYNSSLSVWTSSSPSQIIAYLSPTLKKIRDAFERLPKILKRGRHSLCFVLETMYGSNVIFKKSLKVLLLPIISDTSMSLILSFVFKCYLYWMLLILFLSCWVSMSTSKMTEINVMQTKQTYLDHGELKSPG